MELVMEHLCSIDHLLPKTVLVDIMEEDDSSDEGDSSEMTQTNTKLELAKGLDQMCCHFIQYIDRITQKGILPYDVILCLIINESFRRQVKDGASPSSVASRICSSF